MLRKNVKKSFLAILLLFVFTQFAANAQVTQTEGPITVTIESAKVIGDQYFVIGKVSVSKKARLMISQYTTATNNSGETLNAKKIWWAGNALSSVMGFDQNLEADIPYSIQFGFPTNGENLTSLAAINIPWFHHTEQTTYPMILKNVPVADFSLMPAEMVELDNNLFLKWTKAEETKNELKIHFVLDNQATKEATVRFQSFGIALIDNEGSQHEGSLSLADKEVKVQKDIPIAGFFSFKSAIKMSDLRMLKFGSRHFDYSVKKIEIPAKAKKK